MVSNKLKINKIFKSDEEIATEMLKETLHEKKDWKRTAHLFKIHTYDKLIKSENRFRVVKCKYCSDLHLTQSDMESPSILSAILWVGLVIATVFCLPVAVITNIALLLGYSLSAWKILCFWVVGLPSCWLLIKRTLEKIWMTSDG